MCEAYRPDCFSLRNRYMVDRCNRVIAVYDGRETGGTFSTMRYAQRMGRELIILNV